MTSKIVVNNIESDTGIASVTFTSKVNLSGGITGNFGSDNIGINTDNPIQTLDVRGEATFGAGITKTDLDWGTDTNQRVYSFSGNPGSGNADGVILLASPNTNPSAARVGTIVFGNKVVGTANTSVNPGIKAYISGYTNTNIAESDDTGGYINFGTKRDGYAVRDVVTINSVGHVTMPYQPVATAINMTSAVNTGGEGSFSKIVFTIAITNRGSHYSTSTGYFTCPVAGVYYVNAMFLTRAISGSAAHNVFIRKNDVTTNVKGRDIIGATGHEQCTGVTGYIDCNVNDTLSIYVSNGNAGDFYNEFCYVNFSLFG